MTAYTPVFRVQLVKEASVPHRPKLESSEKAREVATSFLADSAQESFCVLPLDTKNRVIGIVEVTRGTLNSSLVHPREVFAPCIVANACGVIIVHNNPSGDLTPSREDWAVFDRLRHSGEILGISVVDSLIVGEGTAISMMEQGRP